MNTREIIAQRGNATLLHATLKRDELFTWQEQVLEGFSDLDAHIDTWDFSGFCGQHLYAMTIVLMPKETDHAPELYAALSTLMDSQRGLNLQAWIEATDVARIALRNAQGEVR